MASEIRLSNCASASRRMKGNNILKFVVEVLVFDGGMEEVNMVVVKRSEKDEG